MKTNRLASIALATLAVAGSAQAADMSAAPIYKASPAIAGSSWTGFYAGFGLGFRASRTDATLTSEAGILAGQGGTSQPYDGLAFHVSPYAGFNWQFAPRWVAGVEGDFAFAKQTTTRGGIAVPLILGELDFSGEDSLSVKNTWDSSLRGRFGYLLTPSTLAYATGGIAWQHYELASTCGCTGALSLLPNLVTNFTTKTGWTVGAGLETALWGHWLARAEYRYADFGTGTLTVAHSGTTIIAGIGPVSFVDNFDVKVRMHTATFGIAYKFGDPIASEDAGGFGASRSNMTPGAMSWSGPYVGLGLGARASRDDLTATALSTGGTPTDLGVLATSQPFNGTGFRGDPYAGFNWQFAPRWVAGLETDLGIAGHTTTLPGFISPTLRTFVATDGLAVKTTWDASLRGRFGFLLTPATLLYATGGVAWQHYDISSTCADTRCFTITTDGFSVRGGTVSNSFTKTGWTVGGGIEAALWGHWLARGEYRYADFGSRPFTIVRSSGDPGFDPVVESVDAKLRTHTVTFGLAYKFN